jgi:hypothetical protein
MWIYNFTVLIVSQKISRSFFVQNLIPYKTYIREKHLESILGTRKNMTKKSIQFEYLQAYSHDRFSKILRTFCHDSFSKTIKTFYSLTVMIVSQKYPELSMQVKNRE